MHKTLNNVAKVAAVTLALSFAAGCATVSTQDLEKLRQESADAAAQARAAADAANRSANEAKTLASQADTKADRALQAAEEANRCCLETRESIDRMFKRSMQK